MKDLEAARSRARRRSSQRLPSRRILLLTAFVLFCGVSWLVEIHRFLWYTFNCEALGHRDPRYVASDNSYLCLTDVELAGVLRELAFTAVALFQAHQITYFLESGTLLGAFREQGIIRHDADVDMGIDGAGLDYLRTHKVAVPPGYVLNVWNSELYPDSPNDDKLPVRLIHKATGLYVDVFAFLEWKNNAFWGQDAVGPVPSVCFHGCKACPKVGERYRHFTVPHHWVYPLVDCFFEGRMLKCPRESAKYLEHMYGKDYMIPQ